MVSITTVRNIIVISIMEIITAIKTEGTIVVTAITVLTDRF